MSEPAGGLVRFFVWVQRWVAGGVKRLLKEPKVISCVQGQAPRQGVQAAVVPVPVLCIGAGS